MVKTMRWIAPVALLVATGCGPTAETVADLAHSVHGVNDEAALARALRGVNGGREVVPPSVASQLRGQEGVLGDIMGRVDERIGQACDAFEAGEHLVVVLQPDERFAVQAWLDRMWTAITDGAVQQESVKMACKVQSALEHSTF